MNLFSVLTLGDIEGEMIALIAVTGGIFVAIVAFLTSAITAITVNRQTERTRREIAAYVAEGSMTPDEGARLIAAGANKQDAARTGCGMKHA